MPFKTVERLSSQEFDDTMFTELHAALGYDSFTFTLNNGWLAWGVQQGGDSQYYSILIVSYAAVMYAKHMPSGWERKWL